MNTPLIVEIVIRLESLHLAAVCGALALAVLGLALALPVARAAARRAGRLQARPDLVAALARMSGRWQAAREEVARLERELAEVRAEHARLAGAVSHTWSLAQEEVGS